MFVVAASFVACNYSLESESMPEAVEVETTFEFQGPDSAATLPFNIDSIKTVNQLLDSLDAVKVQ